MTAGASSDDRPSVTFLLTSPDAVGGTERATFQLTAVLAAANTFSVSILGVFRDSDVPRLGVETDVSIDYLVDRRIEPAVDSGPSRLVDPQWEAAFTADTDEALELFLRANTPDVVVATTPSLLALACQLASPATKIIGVEHRATAARGISSEPLRKYGRQADALVSLTPDGSAWFRSVLGPDHPILATIPNLIPDGFVPRSSCMQPMVVAAGRLVRSKQFGHVVEAFSIARRAGWRMRIFGEGPERDAIQRTVIRLGMHDHVDLVPFVPDLRHELAKASILVMSSTAEGLPLVAMEALATGVPIVSYDCPVGPRAIIDDGVNGLLVRPNDIDGLARAIERLIDDEDLRARLGTGAADSRSRFAPARIAEQWATVIADVASTSRPRRLRAAAQPTVHLPVEVLDSDEPWVPEGGLLLHVGPHKTGTTALQSAFSADREGLARLGVTYPGVSAAPHGAVMSRLGTWRGWDDAIAPGPADAWTQLCVETRTARGTVVVSSEAFSHATSTQAREICRELRHGPVRVAITLRALEHVLPSSWQEYVKSGWTTTFDDFLHAVLVDPSAPTNPTPTFWIRQDHGRLVRRWADAVGAENVVVVVADPLQPFHLFASFERMLCLPPGSLDRVGAANRSLTAIEAELLRQLNVAVKASIPWNQFNRLLRQGGTPQLVERRHPPATESRPKLPRWAVERARALGAESIEAIRSSGVRVDGDLRVLVPSTTLAPGESGRAQEQVDDAPIDAVVELLDGVLTKMEQLAARSTTTRANRSH